MNHHLVPLALLLSVARLVAQADAGPVLALPHGFSVDPATLLPGLLAGAIGFSDTGIDGTLPPPPAPMPGQPDFTTFLGGAAVDVDALSIGQDWIVSNAIGEAVIAPDQWAAITFTVTRGTTAVPGSLIRAASSEPDGAAADLFGYVIPGSNLPASLVGVPFRAQDSRETSTFAAGVPGNLDAHDIYIALLYQENPQLGALLPPPTVFFSVTAATAAAIPSAWTAVPALRNGATVFATTWNPVSSTWSLPSVALTPAALGLLPSEDVDALALDLMHGRVLFSTDRLLPPPPSGLRDAILFSPLGSGTNFVYRLPGGSPISAEVGLGLAPDDVDGICSLDPGGVGAPSQNRLPFQLGTAAPPLPTGLPTLLQAAVWRRFDRTLNQEFAETWMTGWPPPGVVQPSLAIVGATLGSATAPYTVLTFFVRPQPGNGFAGHPEHHRIAIPPALSLSGQQLFFLWGALSPTTFDVSHPVGILL